MTNNKFKSYDDGIDMSDINAMFKERDAMKIVNNYESSTMTSVTRRRPRRKKKSPNGYIVALATIVAAGGITLAARTIDITPKGSLHDFGKDVGSIVYVKDDDFNPRYDSTNIGIVSQNTKRNANTYYYDQDLKGPIAIVIGNEGSGMSEKVKNNCDFLVKIPMKGKVTSLNASVSAGIVIYEAVKQRM